MNPVRVLIADDSDSFREALREIVDATPGFSLVAEATSGESAVELAARTTPDVALIDARMPGLGGMGAAERIAADQPDALVVLITADSGSPGEDMGVPTIDKRSLSPHALRELVRVRGR